MAGTTNTGVVNYISNPVAVFPKNSITVDIFGNVFYRDYAFGAGDDTGVYWNDEKEYSQATMLFFTIAMQRSLYGKFSFGNKLRSSQSLDFKFQLPVTPSGDIDFAFMEKFIAELEAERIAELEAYLLATGLSDYILTAEEKAVLKAFRKDKADKDVTPPRCYPIDFKEFTIGDLFESSNGNFDLQKNHINGVGDYVITAGLTNNGILGKTDFPAKVFESNTITVDMFGNAFYRQFEYKMVTHARVFSLKPKFIISKNQGLFLSNSFNFMSKKFGYDNMCSWEKIKTDIIQLPALNGEPDYALMETLISAVQKLVIKDVVQYAERKIEATKYVIH